MADGDLLPIAFRAFVRARARYDEIVRSGRGELPGFLEAIIAPTAEAVYWVRVLHERMCDLSLDYKGTSGPARGVVDGLGHPRNVSTHHLLTLSERRGGVQFPMVFPMTFGSYIAWLPAGPEPGHRLGKTAHRHYAEHVQGKPVEETLITARDWFVGASERFPGLALQYESPSAYLVATDEAEAYSIEHGVTT
jgi:hypothetical protein